MDLQRLRSRTNHVAVVTSSPISLQSSLTLSSHLLLWRPLDPSPATLLNMALHGTLWLSILSTCSNNLNLLSCIMSVTGFSAPSRFLVSSFLGHQGRPFHILWVSFVSALSAHVSELQRSVYSTDDFYTWNLVDILIISFSRWLVVCWLLGFQLLLLCCLLGMSFKAVHFKYP